jgi:signal transduction histidine kinase/CheY-like chemotaxis protein
MILAMAGLYVVFDFQSHEQAVSFVESWAASEDLTVQEGNIVAAFSRQQRVMFASRFVRSFTVVETEKIGDSVADPLVSFGAPVMLSKDQTPSALAVAHSTRVAPFEYLVTYRFANHPELVVGFLLSPPFVKAAFIGSTLSFFAVLLVVIVVVRRFSRHEETRRFELVRSAIASTFQMVAHDVRRPLTLAKSGLDLIGRATDMDEVKETLRVSTTEVSRAIFSVDGLLQDVLEMGSVSVPELQPVRVESLLEAVLTDIGRIFPKADVHLQYKFNHKHLALVDTIKVGRVFLNILSNAIQAMNGQGNIGFETKEVFQGRTSMIEFTVSNDGPAISAEIVSRVFDAYFTAGKRGGTGLGLAIARKIVLAHGGEIACDTELMRGVKFKFTLPTADVVVNPPENSLPQSIHDTAQGLSRMAAEESSEVAIQEAEAERLFIGSCGTGEAIKVLIVDDEAIFRNAVADIIRKRQSVQERIEILFASSSKSAIELAMQIKPQLIILDLDLGADSVSGLEVAAYLKKEGVNSHICIHTNRVFSSASQKEMALISDSFLPKPISATSLLTLLRKAAERAQQHKPAIDTAQVSNEVFVLVEDSAIVRTKWKRMWTRGRLVTFAKPADFWSRVAEQPPFLELLTAVFTDQYFDNETGINGLAFAKELRRRRPVPVFLATNGSFSQDEIKDSVDDVVGKEPPNAAQITKLLNSQSLKG